MRNIAAIIIPIFKGYFDDNCVQRYIVKLNSPSLFKRGGKGESLFVG